VWGAGGPGRRRMRQPRMWVSVTLGALLCACVGTGPAFAYRDNISEGENSAAQANEGASATEARADEDAASTSASASSDQSPAASQTGSTAGEAGTSGNGAKRVVVREESAVKTTKPQTNISTGNGRPRASANRPGSTSIVGKYKGSRTNKWRELALSGKPQALDQLLTALQYYPGVSYSTPNSIRTRRDAAEALGVLGDPRALRALEDALNDPDFLVRQHAARSIAIIKERNR